jgi:hypothetical protein
MLLAALLVLLVTISGLGTATVHTTLRVMTVIGVFVPGRKALRAILSGRRADQPRPAGRARHTSTV